MEGSLKPNIRVIHNEIVIINEQEQHWMMLFVMDPDVQLHKFRTNEFICSHTVLVLVVQTEGSMQNGCGCA